MSRQPQAKPATTIDPSPMFEEDYLDIDHWPHRWRVEAADLLVGQQLLDVFKPFLQALLSEGLARKTLRRHRDNLCDLGGEIISRLTFDPPLRPPPVMRLLNELIDEDGGPLLYPSRSEPLQRSFDTTCRKLYLFLFS